MSIELFGRNNQGNYEFLGYFGKEEQLLRAVDEYYAQGYRGLKYTNWVVSK